MAVPIAAAAAVLGSKTANEATSTLLNVLTIADYVAKQFRDNIPTIQDEVVVEVVGQPGSNKQELYYLAMAAANGIVQRRQPLLQINPFLPPSAASMMIEYDAADHWVRCSLTYRSAALKSLGTSVAPAGVPSIALDSVFNAFSLVVPGAIFFPFLAGLATQPLFFDTAAVYRGPQCDVVGGTSDFRDALLPGIPASELVGAPKLPWVGKTILTSCPTVADPRPIDPITQNPPPSTELKSPGPQIPSPNPKPSGDNRSRGSVVGPGSQSRTNSRTGQSPGVCCPKTALLVELVTASLTDPGSNALETWVPPESGPGTTVGSPVGG